MKNIKIVIGSDHRGYKLKEFLKSDLEYHIKNLEITDVGTHTQERTDYPIYAKSAVMTIKNRQADLGILLCGSGVGVAIAANRFDGIYAGVAWSVEVAVAAKADDNINVLVLPADFVDRELSIKIVLAWLATNFKGDNTPEGKVYTHRIKMIDKIKG